MKDIPTSIAFTIWTSLSIIFIKLVEVAFFNHKISWVELFFLGSLISRITGLKMIAKS